MTQFNVKKINKKYRNMYDDACLVSLAWKAFEISEFLWLGIK